jgi:hypothetical protein
MTLERLLPALIYDALHETLSILRIVQGNRIFQWVARQGICCAGRITYWKLIVAGTAGISDV